MRLVVIDASNTLYRAFFALPPLRSSSGVPTNAVLGFVNMLVKVIREEAPDYLVVVFDAPGKSFRHSLYPAYKATRDAQPEDLSAQLPILREVIEAYRIPILQVDGVEADDAIATLVATAPAEASVGIVSTDKDLMQLVDERVELLDTMKDQRYGPAEVEQRFGVPPEKILDVRALVGDPSDNIPGVRGIGEKGAAKLIAEWGNLENLLAHVDDVSAKRPREALQQHAEQARLSRRLAELRRDVELRIEFQELARREADRARLRELFSKLEFSRLLAALDGEEGGGPRPAAGPAVDTRVVRAARELAALVEELSALESVTLALVPPAAGFPGAAPAGVALALDDARAAYVPLGEGKAGAAEFPEAIDALRPVLEGPRARPWLARDAKKLQVALGEGGLELGLPVGDVGVAAFLLDPSAGRTTASLASAHLQRPVRDWEELAGRGAKARRPDELPPEELAAWAGEDVCAVRALAPVLGQRLERDGLRPLFDDVELPLTAVLARMERAGVRVDEEFLGQLSEEWEKELSRIEAEIHSLAGERFLVSSPKQLQRILFEKLKLPVVKKTKTGYSTDEKVLEQLAFHHELPARILAHRHLAKLKNTYVDALPPLVNAATGRIHPTFHQTGAATGRLSCSDPNLQNIPIRTEEGVRIREAFIPAEGAQLLSADYSQVELRILAHFSGDESLTDAFERGEDIHRRTAAEVAGIDSEQVTPEQRARAKAINFGIIYGSSAFGIANQLGIATAEAQETIDAYFARYRGVRAFLDRTVERAREEGFVRTLLGRRRYLPDLRSRNRVLRNAAERMAVNTVIQGTAADLIKKAMVEVDEGLGSAGRGARMILQVHDELLLEVPRDAVEATAERVREIMAGVHALEVSLEVEVGVGRTWREAH